MNLLSYLFPGRRPAPRQANDPFPMHNRSVSNWKADRLTRALRHERGLRIAVGHSKVPPGWEPHPVTLATMRNEAPPIYAFARWSLSFAAWKVRLNVSCTYTNQPLECSSPTTSSES